MGNELPYMPTFIGDFMTAVASWPPERVGAYWLALMYSWEHNGLPADDEEAIAAIFHVRSMSTTRRLWSEIGHKFFRHADGLWRNWKQEAVRVEATRQHAATRAHAGANARWGKGANGRAQAMPTQSLRNAQALPEQSVSNANHNQNQITPPQPPAAAGGAQASAKPPTRAEQQWAVEFRRERMRSRHPACPHTPTCEAELVCIGRLVQQQREALALGQTLTLREASGE
jgi:uncharacterized protein YdaU (DUF1376 family)